MKQHYNIVWGEPGRWGGGGGGGGLALNMMRRQTLVYVSNERGRVICSKVSQGRLTEIVGRTLQ